MESKVISDGKEGAVIAGVTTEAADDSIQANLVSVYGK